MSIAGVFPLRGQDIPGTVHNGRSRRVALATAAASVMKYRGARPAATSSASRPGGPGVGSAAAVRTSAGTRTWRGSRRSR